MSISVPQSTLDELNTRQALDYEEHFDSWVQWALTFGKHPERVEGLSEQTMDVRAYRVDKFYRWVWADEGYTTSVSHEHADAYLKHLAYGDYSGDHRANTQKALRTLYKWRTHEHDWSPWEPSLTFTNPNQTSTPREFLTREERPRIRDAALDYGSIPHYNSVSPNERDRWNAYLAQRYGKTKGSVTRDDWRRANGWKIPSLVSVSLDAGLRPIEVERARTGWVDLDNRVLRIPKDQASKSQDNWVVGLQSRTVEMLRRWLEQRPLVDLYEDTDALWLTREGNAYGSHALSYLLDELCDIAGISTENRQLSWYAIRHSVGTYMAREAGLAAAQMQLRHKSEQTTMKYDQAPVEDRQDALERMG
ncbi:tyrosine-type recombinase/integrase [Halomarina salina]|uniref:Tyrosine-type recombinase/integrase n=1 Tax=Halomarina salina TaxID=1872699 RepID=A0ABD5RK92_9EURY|nr:site-specific integrase [Halomarina salina]